MSYVQILARLMCRFMRELAAKAARSPKVPFNGWGPKGPSKVWGPKSPLRHGAQKNALRVVLNRPLWGGMGVGWDLKVPTQNFSMRGYSGL